MSYCSSCGQPGEGRFCRMCGVPMPGQPGAAPVQMMQTVDAYSQAGVAYATPPVQPDPQFESLFRQPEGVINPHSQTRVLPPITAVLPSRPVNPAGPPNPDGTEEWPRYGGGDERRSATRHSGAAWDGEDPPVNRRMLIWGAVGAMAVVAAVILGLLYLGSKTDSANTAAGSATTGAPASSATGAATPGSISLPSGALPSSQAPSATPSASASTATTTANGGDTLPLSTGSSGNLVQYVQQRLQQLGLYQGQITGQYDQATANAVVQFQGRAQLNGDPAGTVGQSTLTALIAAGSKPGLRPGSHDADDIERLQQALNAAENAGLAVNGRYDAQTQAAVAQYQQAAGLNPTGQTGGNTWGKLQAGFIVS